jgi:putative FmdB family regulatory protein
MVNCGGVTAGLEKTGELVVPIYEYRCESCDHRLEKLQKMSEGDLVDCPECERPALKRLISAAAFRLKGSGWYETDFKKDNKRNLDESSHSSASSNGTPGKSSDSSSSKNAEKPASAASENKPAVKPAAKSTTKESKNA